MSGVLTAAAVLHVAAREMLAVAAVGIAIVGIDDVVLDLGYFARWLWRGATVYRRNPRASADDPSHAEPGAMALFVPAWDESAVIGAMLDNLRAVLDYPAYRVFVGVYPNDPATAAAVTALADPAITLVTCTRPGPTTKADCLNHLWRALCRHEAATGQRFKAVVLHDAEDVVHPRELHVFDRLMPRLAMVQLPVTPLADTASRWVSGHYIDEFAEAHAKDMVVREALGAALPSAGVACAVARDVMDRLAAGRAAPFDADSMTEDYELGLRIHALGGRGAIVRLASGRRLVTTREHFPATLDAALRQKTRWLTGIALDGWDRVGWTGSWADRYMLLRDRKALITAALTATGYVAALLVIADLVLRSALPATRGFGPLASPGSALAVLLWANSAMFGWRLGLRMGFTATGHGWREGLRAAPRAVVGNLINAAAAVRAVRAYSRRQRGHERAVWDKTSHRFPNL